MRTTVSRNSGGWFAKIRGYSANLTEPLPGKDLRRQKRVVRKIPRQTTIPRDSHVGSTCDPDRSRIDENQLGRRNHTEDQRAAVALRVVEQRSALAKKERAEKGREKGGDCTPEQVARRLSVKASDKRSGKPKTDTRQRRQIRQGSRAQVENPGEG
jgi:hypothetical protein